jgi:hypothetical protein
MLILPHEKLHRNGFDFIFLGLCSDHTGCLPGGEANRKDKILFSATNYVKIADCRFNSVKPQNIEASISHNQYPTNNENGQYCQSWLMYSPQRRGGHRGWILLSQNEMYQVTPLKGVMKTICKLNLKLEARNPWPSPAISNYWYDRTS